MNNPHSSCLSSASATHASAVCVVYKCCEPCSKSKTPPDVLICYVKLLSAVHTMAELKLSGNHLKGSRPVLSFDASFDQQPHLQLMKEMFTQSFATPRRHPKSKPFHDHVISFHFLDNRIWLRNYQARMLQESSLAMLQGSRLAMHCTLCFAMHCPALVTTLKYVLHSKCITLQVSAFTCLCVSVLGNLDELHSALGTLDSMLLTAAHCSNMTCTLCLICA